jgi:hypothetical protein
MVIFLLTLSPVVFVVAEPGVAPGNAAVTFEAPVLLAVPVILMAYVQVILDAAVVVMLYDGQAEGADG